MIVLHVEESITLWGECELQLQCNTEHGVFNCMHKLYDNQTYVHLCQYVCCTNYGPPHHALCTVHSVSNNSYMESIATDESFCHAVYVAGTHIAHSPLNRYRSSSRLHLCRRLGDQGQLGGRLLMIQLIAHQVVERLWFTEEVLGTVVA